MKRVTIYVLLAVFCLLLVGCKAKSEPSASEVVPADYGAAVETAKEQFQQIFENFENLTIDQTATMVRTANENQLVVQITYSSDNGSGVYGFLFQKDDAGNTTLLRQGEDITIDQLLS